MEKPMNNITLIGMPGAGKSTLGVLLAKRMGYSFHDTDITIQVQTGKTLSELMADIGGDALMKIENDIIASLTPKREVIATGGSAVFGPEGMENLKKRSHIVYLKVSLSEIEKRVGDLVERGVVLNGCKDITELYDQRVSRYEHYAEITIDCDGKTVEQCIDSILQAVKETEK